VILAVLSLLLCQLLGEVVAQTWALPVPGPVLGMVLLAGLLVWRGRLNSDIARAADFLLGHLSLFFVPAAVGVMANGARIARECVPICVAILVSTVSTIIVSALVFQAVMRAMGRDEQP